MDYQITVNGTSRTVSATLDTPLLYVLMNELGLKGPRFGCGLAQCGSCSVLLDGVEIRSCITPVADVQGKALTTLEGLPALYAQQKGLAQAPAMHPLQQAFIDVQAPQCGYCYNGMTIKGSELLAKNPKPTEVQIRDHMDGHLCRCGTYPRVMKANQGATTSSSSIERGGPQIRAAAAEARRALLNLASNRLRVQIGSLVVNKGIVSIDGHPTQSVSYGALLGDKPFNVKFTGTAPQKPINRYRLVGASVPRVDIPAKASGTYVRSEERRVGKECRSRGLRYDGRTIT